MEQEAAQHVLSVERSVVTSFETPTSKPEKRISSAGAVLPFGVAYSQQNQ